MITKRQSGRLAFTGIALDAIHHGAGTSGNTSMLRTQEIVTEDGEDARVPFISGNSIKHMIRQAGVEHAIEVMGVEDGSLSKQVVDLLFSGGHLSKSGAAVNLRAARSLAELFPILSICGYSAGNYMTASKLQVDQVHLVCRENAFRLPTSMKEVPQSKLRAATFRGEDFGTRHEASKNPHVRRLLTGAQSKQLTDGVSDRLDAAVDTGKMAAKQTTSQMIYDYQVIMPGALLYGGLSYRDLDPLEMAALKASLSHACRGEVPSGLVYHFGAKSSIGLGRVALKWSGTVRGIVAAPTVEDASVIPQVGPDWEGAYAAHLRERRGEILEALASAVS